MNPHDIATEPGQPSGPVSLTTADSRSTTRLAVLATVAIAGVLAALPFAWRHIAGATDFPAGDAWAYERIFDTFHRTGRIEMVGWNDLVLVGVLPVAELWVSIVGYGREQLGLLGVLMSFVALLAARDMFESMGLRRQWFPITIVGTTLGLVGVSGTFLSDSFYFAAVAWAVALALRIKRTPSPGQRSTLALAIGSGLICSYGFSIRQHAGAACVAIVVMLWGPTRRPARPAVAVAVSFAVIAIPTYLWRRTLENGGSEMLVLAPRASSGAFWAATITLLLVPIPYLAPYATYLPRVPPWPYWLPLASALVAAPLSSSRLILEQPSVVSELTQGETLGWIVAFALLATTPWTGWMIVDALSRSSHPPTIAASRVSLLVIAALVATSALVTAAYYPRYALVEVSLLIGLLHHTVQIRRDHPVTARSAEGAGAVAGIVVLAVISYWSLDRSVAPVRAIFDAGRVAACAGIVGAELDGGFVWNGIHTPGPVDPTRSHVAPDDGLPETVEQSVFVDLKRKAVLLQSRPTTDQGLAVIGPFESHGLLPGVSGERWLVAFPELAPDLERCRAMNP